MDQCRRIPVGRDLAKLRGGQDRQRRGGGDAQGTRRAEHGVDDQGHEGRIEAHLDGQSGNCCVRQGLRDDDCGGREPGSQVGPQPLPAIVRHPVEQRYSKAHVRHPLTFALGWASRRDSRGPARWRHGASGNEPGCSFVLAAGAPDDRVDEARVRRQVRATNPYSSACGTDLESESLCRGLVTEHPSVLLLDELVRIVGLSVVPPLLSLRQLDLLAR